MMILISLHMLYIHICTYTIWRYLRCFSHIYGLAWHIHKKYTDYAIISPPNKLLTKKIILILQQLEYTVLPRRPNQPFIYHSVDMSRFAPYGSVVDHKLTYWRPKTKEIHDLWAKNYSFDWQLVFIRQGTGICCNYKARITSLPS